MPDGQGTSLLGRQAAPSDDVPHRQTWPHPRLPYAGLSTLWHPAKAVTREAGHTGYQPVHELYVSTGKDRVLCSGREQEPALHTDLAQLAQGKLNCPAPSHVDGLGCRDGNTDVPVTSRAGALRRREATQFGSPQPVPGVAKRPTLLGQRAPAAVPYGPTGFVRGQGL